MSTKEINKYRDNLKRKGKMPTYSYKCTACEDIFDIAQKITEDELTHCDKCGKDTLRKYFSCAPTLVFKGSGWSVPRPHEQIMNDYKKKKKRKMY